MDADELEKIIRRVVREELQRFHAGGVRKPPGVEHRRRGAIAYDDEGMVNVRRVLAYCESIDPDNTMPKDELRHLLRMKFPEYSL